MSAYLQEMWNSASHGQPQGIWFWASLYAVVVCAYSAIYQLRVRGWPSASGQLHRASVSTFGPTPMSRSDRQFHADASYTYTVSGSEYSGRRVSPWIILTNVPALIQRQLKKIDSTNSGAISVFYNPNKPQKSYLLLPGKVGIVVTLIVGALPGLGFFLRYYV